MQGITVFRFINFLITLKGKDFIPIYTVCYCLFKEKVMMHCQDYGNSFPQNGNLLLCILISIIYLCTVFMNEMKKVIILAVRFLILYLYFCKRM